VQLQQLTDTVVACGQRMRPSVTVRRHVITRSRSSTTIITIIICTILAAQLQLLLLHKVLPC